VAAGGGRILACLKQHKDQVSDGCRQAVTAALQGTHADAGGSGAAPIGQKEAAGGGPPPGKPPEAPPAMAAPAAHAGMRESTAAGGSADGKGGNYVVMKQGQILDQSSGKDNTVAYRLLVPTAWDLQGWVRSGVAEGGCFPDFFSMYAQARSADGSIDLQLLPQSSWQYVDDPAAQNHLRQHNELDRKYKMKPCPIRAPVGAAELLRRDILPKLHKETALVSIEAFPQLDQIARHQLGLPPGTGGNVGGVRTDAARARLAYDDESGRPTEAWVTAVVVVRSFPAGGRGAGYDWRAVDLMVLHAPKGQLDANDRLLQMIAGSLHPDAAWKSYSDGIVTTLIRAKQQTVAREDAIVAQFQQHVIDTINGVVANQQAGADHAAFAQDQLVRGVQTFRDPSSGATYELSNQYDHAWLNGSNEYLMSEDPNFNPNGKLNGSWTPLEVQR
jgi:hypothetical protein